MEGKKNEEIAAMLQLSVETVKTQKKRAMSYIRNNMDRVLLLSLAVSSGKEFFFEILNHY